MDASKVIATAFADLGFEVHLGPLFETPQEVAALAIDKHVDLVGVSSHAAGHLTLVPELIGVLAERQRSDIHVICGGVIPSEDYAALIEAGVAEIFGPGTNVLQAAMAVLGVLEGRRRNTRRGVPLPA